MRSKTAMAICATVFLVSLVTSVTPVSASSRVDCVALGCTYFSERGQGSNVVAVFYNGTSKKEQVGPTVHLPWCVYSDTYDNETGMLFVSDVCENKVYEVNPATNELVATLEGIKEPTHIACVDAIPACFVVSLRHGYVVPFNPNTLVLGTPVQQCGKAPGLITYDSQDGLLYVSNNRCMTVENPATGAVSIIGGINGSVTGLTYGAGLVYADVVADSGKTIVSSVYVVNGTSISNVIRLPHSVKKVGVNVYDPTDGRIWIISEDGDSTYLLNSTSVSRKTFAVKGNGACFGTEGDKSVVFVTFKDYVMPIGRNGTLGTITLNYGPVGCTTIP